MLAWHADMARKDGCVSGLSRLPKPLLPAAALRPLKDCIAALHINLTRPT